MSIERATMLNIRCVGCIRVDEAAQISVTRLLPLLKPTVKKLSMYSGTTQIGVIDQLSNVPGERVLFKITDFAKTVLPPLMRSYRAGFPFADEYNTIEPGFIGDPTKITYWELIHVKGNDDDVRTKVVECVKVYKVDVAITAIDENIRWLQDTLDRANLTIETSTVFGFQSREAPVVLVLLKRNSSGSWGISRYKSNIVSALSRATTHLIVLLVNSDASEERMADLINTHGGNTKYSRVAFDEPIERQQEIANQSISLVPGASVIVTKLADDTIKYDIKGMFGLGSAKMTYKDGVIIVDSDSDFIKNQILKSIDTNEIEIQNVSDSITSLNQNKLRTLTWLVDKMIGARLGWEFFHNGSYYRITKTRDCPLICGLKLWKFFWVNEWQLVMQTR